METSAHRPVPRQRTWAGKCVWRVGLGGEERAKELCEAFLAELSAPISNLSSTVYFLAWGDHAWLLEV